MRLPVLVAIALAIPACSGQPGFRFMSQSSMNVPAAVPAAEAADAALARDLDAAMHRAAIASARVAGLEMTAANRSGGITAVPPLGTVPAELRTRISIDWTGPVRPLLAAISAEIGYGFHTTGAATAQPVMIALNRRDEPVWEVLRDVGHFIGSEAVVIVDSTERRIEFRRAATDG